MLGFTACAPSVPCDVQLSDGIAAVWCRDDPPVIVIDERAPCPVEVVRAAAAEWGPLAPSSIEVGAVPAEGHEHDGEITISVGAVPDDGEGATLGLTRRYRERGVVRWARITVEVCDRHILAHEIGHALGFTHSEDSSQLMYPATGGDGGVPPELIDAYEAARGEP